MQTPSNGVLTYFCSLHLAAVSLLAWHGASPARAEDWPTYRHDRLRTAATSEQLKLPLEQIWSLKTIHAQAAPRPTADPNWTGYPDSARYNLPMIAVGDAVYFSCAADGRLVCLDAATGKTRWQFIAGGGMNRSPMYWEGNVYCGSDDGHVYCLDAKTGAVVWNYNAAPADRALIRYGSIISAWPVMTDIMIHEGIAYFSNGAFPHDGAFLMALDAKTGKLIYSSGGATENAWRQSLAPGGHLYVTQNHVWVPKDFRGYSGIAYGSGVPFRRQDGKFIGAWGGPDPEGPDTRGTFWPLIGAIKDGVRYGGSIAWKEEKAGNETKRTEIWKQDVPGRWTDGDSNVGVRIGGKHGIAVVIRYDPDLCSVILAGDTAYHIALDSDPKKGVGCGIYARDAKTGNVVWTTELPERANQLIAANGRLLASTKSGTIYCFAPAGTARHGVQEEKALPVTSGKDVAEAAEKIVKHSGVTEGYALVVDCEDGQLASELAKQTRLTVCAVFRDAAAMHKAREKFAGEGLHLTRIVTWHQPLGAKLPYPSYIADLIVSEGAVAGKSLPDGVEELARVCKPIRGVMLIGGETTKADALAAWTEKTGLKEWQTVDGSWAKRVRPPLEGAGAWTHNFASPGRTACSQDGVLMPPLGVVWFGPPFVDKGTSHMALICNGILVNPDAHSLEGYDQYTGRKLWRLEAPNVAVQEGQLAVSPKHVYVKYGHGLVQLDLLTGKELATYNTPYGEKHGWDWYAVSEDGKTVWGASAGGLFAIEMESGKGNIQWQLGGPEAAEKFGAGGMSDGVIYILAGAPKDDQKAELIADMRKFFQNETPELRDEFEKQINDRDIRELIGIDAATGKILYRRAADVSNCGGKWLRPTGYGGKRQINPHVLGDSYAHKGVVVFGTTAAADKGWTIWYGGGYSPRALTGYDLRTGKFLWYTFANYRARPVIVDDTVHAEPWAFDLRTGVKKTRQHPISGQETDWAWCRWDKQCGTFSASKYFLFGRSMGLGYQDLLTDQGLYTFWHSRGSCWMDCVSGGGTMIKPPVSLGCVCQWNMPFTIALGHVPTQPTAAPTFAAPGPSLPVKHLRLDYGANGDRRDSDGNMWLHAGLPAEHQLFLAYPVKHEMYEKNDAVQRTAFYTPIQNAKVPFVFASTQIGLKKSILPVTTKDGQGQGKFKVRLGFSALPGDKPGQRVFDVKLNGQTVLPGFDAAKEAGQADKAIWKEFTLDLAGDLILELDAKSGTDDLANLPAINALEVIRQ